MTATYSALRLVVNNPQELQQGSQPAHDFDTRGGSIGSRGASWLLFDRDGRVSERHCEIRYQDGGFAVIDRSGRTMLNDQTQPLGIDGLVLLSDGDKLRIGPYEVSVHLGSGPGHSADCDQPFGDAGQLPAELLQALPDSEPNALDDSSRQHAGWAEFQALAEPPRPQGLLDPLEALDGSPGDGNAAGALDPRHYGHTPLAAQPDVSTTRFEAVYGTPMHTPGEPRMLDQDSSSPAAQEWLQRQLSSHVDPASLVEPLVEGIGAPVGTIDGQQAHALLNESGRALAALVRGLCALNAPSPDGQQRISLAGRTLQPIEDNPLRLGQSYPDTVRALFSAERSVVHLSASAAVEESLEQIRRQQIAMHKAISAGLAALLQAFSPEQLLQRFERYRPALGGQAQADDWAWQMYGHYYSELTCGRQQGFDKLFWEVFEQAFDQALRAES
ncbi:type VI secretion system-associated FHA domain protein TagH [Pseudomonas japonica]|uniref:FHA domain protein n=1 Tax=Pseudomonas japonica TaxID=256466 RepID=A0A239CP96_9PSED|nr:type VI secretion system-associated FHA domain protein TagH [Pseudomonas japonica]SNS21153.1 FHA domain protein [Pseudomonas japonica]